LVVDCSTMPAGKYRLYAAWQKDKPSVGCIIAINQHAIHKQLLSCSVALPNFIP